MKLWALLFVWIKMALSAFVISSYSGLALGAAITLVVPMWHVTDTGIGEPAGTIVVSQTPYGLLFTPALYGLLPGLHGFHVHTEPTCAAIARDGKKGAALAAGGHFDPAKADRHAGPYDTGHLGDLPALYVDAEGKSSYPVLAPRITSAALLKGRSLVIHAGGDNHADHPLPLGGGGMRVVCGMILSQ